MPIRFTFLCAAGSMLLLCASASAATASNAGLQQAWQIPALIALLGAVALLGLYALVMRRRRAKALAAVVVKARERSLQRHTERQRIATQFADADF